LQKNETKASTGTHGADPALSYAHGASDQPLLYETIGNAFDRIVAEHPSRTALISRHQKIRWSYRKFQEEVDGIAAGLIALGLEPGERIGIWSPNCAQWAVTQYATAKAGLILVNINPAYRPQELEYCLNKVGCSALVMAARFKGSNYIDMLNALAPELASSEVGQLHAPAVPSLRTVIRIDDEEAPGYLNFGKIASIAQGVHRDRVASLSTELQPDDPINIQFTSGTTGTPKGATLTHFNILNNALFAGIGLGMSETDVMICPLPLYHCAGMVLCNLTCMTHGAAVVYPDEAFEPTSVLKAVADEGATVLGSVPTMFLAQLDHPEFSSFDVSSLRTGFIGGAPCPVELMNRIVSDLHMRDVAIVYGMTETSPVSFQTSLQDPLERRVSTVGRVHPHVEARVADPEGRTVALGVQGEILTRGYSIMHGYWNDIEKTEEAVDAAGWMHTGDLGIMDDEGYLKITGRAKDMVIRGGENIYPREIEEHLYTHPDIQEAQVFGIPDIRMGEELCVWIRTHEDRPIDVDAIRAFCTGVLAHYKIPRHVRFVEDFPMTVTGKIQKFEMRKVMIAELGLQEQATA
jgi:fatty-acyl-CoA synthase